MPDLESLLLGYEQRFANSTPEDHEEVVALLADDFLEFGKSGRIYDKTEIVRLLGESPRSPIRIEDFRVRPLGNNSVLVTYRAIQQTGTESLRSSIWQLQQSNWQLIFHQGTAVENSQLGV